MMCIGSCVRYCQVIERHNMRLPAGPQCMLRCISCMQADAEHVRRLKVASHVYDAWTARGTRIAQLADRYACWQQAQPLY